jgi:hypothetical protein
MDQQKTRNILGGSGHRVNFFLLPADTILIVLHSQVCININCLETKDNIFDSTVNLKTIIYKQYQVVIKMAFKVRKI